MVNEAVYWDMKEIPEGLIVKANLIRQCNLEGHVSSGSGTVTSFHGEKKAYDLCKRCNLLYTREATSEELKSYEQLMNTNFV